MIAPRADEDAVRMAGAGVNTNPPEVAEIVLQRLIDMSF